MQSSIRVGWAFNLVVAAFVVTATAVGCGDGGSSVTDGGNEAESCGNGTLCSGSCTSLSTDNANCGACGTACGAGQVCSGGKCGSTCGSGTKLCGTSCADTQFDPNNCGGCGTKCSTGEVCSNGTCGTTCATGQTFCGADAGTPYCANTTTDNANCGGCGVTCGAGKVCSNGACASSCGGGDGGAETLCTPDGGAAFCANTNTDNANCGGCGIACGGGQACSNAVCTATCGNNGDGGVQTLCTPDGGAPYCANTNTDNANCGTCGTTCAAGHVCDGTGKCSLTCQLGLTDCNGTCTNPSFDPNNCGTCGTVCPLGDSCTNGACVPTINNLLIVSGNATGGFLTCVQTGLAPYFPTITTVAGVPTQAQLDGSDAVLVYNNGMHSDPVSLGNALADFSDAKGHVVEALYGTGGLSPMAGRWATDGYSLFSGNWDATSVTLGTISEPQSPLVIGITTFATTRSVKGSAANGGTVVASYSDGNPMIIRGSKNGRNRVDLGMFPGGCSGAFWTGNGFEMMRDALFY